MHKDKPNFCEHFDPSADPGAPAASDDADALRKAAEALFK